MMKHYSLLVLALILSFEVRSQAVTPKTLAEAEAISPNDLERFTQTEYKLVDPAGDYAILKRSQFVPKRLLNKMMGKKPQATVKPPTIDANLSTNQTLASVIETEPVRVKEPIEKLAEYCALYPDEAPMYNDLFRAFGQSSPENMKKLLVGLQNVEKPIQGRENPINRKGFSDMFAQVITEEQKNGIEPSHGEPHTWSKEFLDKHGTSSPMLISSKLLMALSLGETNKYMKTDKEEDLHNWMLTQPDNSLELSELFRSSYRLNKGDVYKTLLTIENVLANQWRNKKREKLPFVKKLKPITSGHEYAQDKFGTWYHLFGIMILGYVEGGMKANFVGRVEAIGSVVLSPNVNKTQKGWMNKSGGLVGGDLAKMIKRKKYLNHKADPKHLEISSYLHQKEDFRDRVKVPVDEHIVASITPHEDRVFVDIKDEKKRELKNCKVEMIPDNGTGLDARKKDVAKNVSLTSLTTLQFFDRDVKRIRGFISCPDYKETLVFETK